MYIQKPYTGSHNIRARFNVVHIYTPKKRVDKRFLWRIKNKKVMKSFTIIPGGWLFTVIDVWDIDERFGIQKTKRKTI
jgi:hypothetical protein